MSQSMDIALFAAQTLGGTYGNPEPTLVRNQGTFQGQCVSLERQALSAIDGVNFGSLGNAVDYANAKAQEKYASIGYSWKPGDTNFQDGDVLVYGDDPGSFTGKEGHIARWYQGKLLNQNYGGSLKVTQNNFFSAGYLGRYTKGENMIESNNDVDILYLSTLHRYPESDDVRKSWFGIAWQEALNRIRSSDEWLGQNNTLLVAYPEALETIKELEAGGTGEYEEVTVYRKVK